MGAGYNFAWMQVVLLYGGWQHTCAYVHCAYTIVVRCSVKDGYHINLQAMRSAQDPRLFTLTPTQWAVSIWRTLLSAVSWAVMESGSMIPRLRSSTSLYVQIHHASKPVSHTPFSRCMFRYITQANLSPTHHSGFSWEFVDLHKGHKAKFLLLVPAVYFRTISIITEKLPSGFKSSTILNLITLVYVMFVNTIYCFTYFL
jgi:hypothetical protein